MTDWMTELLEELRWHWGEAYSINHAWPDRWVAQRRDTGATFARKTAAELREAILTDYTARPVPRSARAIGA